MIEMTRCDGNVFCDGCGKLEREVRRPVFKITIKCPGHSIRVFMCPECMRECSQEMRKSIESAYAEE